MTETPLGLYKIGRRKFFMTLERAGYRLKPLGSAERFLPPTKTVREYGRTTKVARDQVVPTTVETYSFGLPTVGSSGHRAGDKKMRTLR
jgi:hypothetical protein